MRLRDIRKARGLSGSEVARRIGVPQSTYSCWELEKAPLSIEKACDLCDVLGCTLDQLAGREQTSDGQWVEIQDIYAALNPAGRDKLIDYAEDLSANPANVQARPRHHRGES